MSPMMCVTDLITQNKCGIFIYFSSMQVELHITHMCTKTIHNRISLYICMKQKCELIFTIFIKFTLIAI